MQFVVALMQVIVIHLFKDRIPRSAPQRKIIHECIHVINPAHSHFVTIQLCVRARAHVRVIVRVCACVHVQCGVRVIH